MIVIVDYKMGNIRSLVKKLELFKIASIVSSDINIIEKAEKIILPGVGNFGEAMKNLNSLNLVETIKEKVIVKKTPILGICLGMQLLTEFSEEGYVEGLGFIHAKTKKFNPSFNGELLRVPHVGWNNISLNKENILFDDIDIDASFYFTHSYFVDCEDINDVLTLSVYGNVFHSGIYKDNVYGLQFHPEKSHFNGLKMLNNFVKKS